MDCRYAEDTRIKSHVGPAVCQSYQHSKISKIFIIFTIFIYISIPKYWLLRFLYIFYNPLARRKAPAEGANIDRRLVPYHAKCMRIQSRIEFIYIFICINGRPFCDGVRRLGTG